MISLTSNAPTVSSPSGIPEHENSEQEQLMEQYTTYLHTIEHFDEQRLHVHEFFMTINSFLGTLFGAIGGYLFASEKGHVLLALPLAIVGFAFSYVWYLWVTNYTTVNKAKWQVIYDMEKKLPYQPFKSEWEDNLERIEVPKPPNYVSWLWRQRKKAYYSVFGIDSLLPKLFGLIYIALGISAIAIWAYKSSEWLLLKISKMVDFLEETWRLGLGWVGIVILILIVLLVIALKPPKKREDSSAS